MGGDTENSRWEEVSDAARGEEEEEEADGDARWSEVCLWGEDSNNREGGVAVVEVQKLRITIWYRHNVGWEALMLLSSVRGFCADIWKKRRKKRERERERERERKNSDNTWGQTVGKRRLRRQLDTGLTHTHTHTHTHVTEPCRSVIHGGAGPLSFLTEQAHLQTPVASFTCSVSLFLSTYHFFFSLAPFSRSLSPNSAFLKQQPCTQVDVEQSVNIRAFTLVFFTDY